MFFRDCLLNEWYVNWIKNFLIHFWKNFLIPYLVPESYLRRLSYQLFVSIEFIKLWIQTWLILSELLFFSCVTCIIFRQNVSWISKLEGPCVTFLGLLTSIKMNRDGKFLCLFVCFDVIFKLFNVESSSFFVWCLKAHYN